MPMESLIAELFLLPPSFQTLFWPLPVYLDLNDGLWYKPAVLLFVYDDILHEQV